MPLLYKDKAMSPRRIILTVEDWPQPRSRKIYRCRIEEYQLDRKAAVLQIALYHLDPEMEGKLQTIDFGLPIRSGNPLSHFITACKLDVSQIGSQICLDDVIGKIVGLRYEKTKDSEKPEVVSFIPIADQSASKPVSSESP